jgi:hypothetical protein
MMVVEDGVETAKEYKLFPKQVPATATEGLETIEAICSINAATAVYLNLLKKRVRF